MYQPATSLESPSQPRLQERLAEIEAPEFLRNRRSLKASDTLKPQSC